MKLYKIYWDDRVTNCATVWADSEEDALDAFQNGEYADIDIVETDIIGEYEVVCDED